jgi:hypothetical protein
MDTAAAPERTKMGELGRLTGVIWSPGEAFQDIARRPGGWIPLAINIVLSLVVIYSFTQRVGWERFMRHQIEISSRAQNMPAAEKEQQIAQGARFAPIGAYVFSVVGIPLMAVITAGVLLVVFRTFLGSEITFRQTFGIVSYAWIPLAISGLLTLAVMLLKNPEDFDLQYPTLTSVGAFLDPLTTPKWLLSLGTSLDVFTFWILVLLATGFAAATRKISWSTCLACVVGPWGILVLVKMCWAAIFG